MKRLNIEEVNDERYLLSVGYGEVQHICVGTVEMIEYVKDYFTGKSEIIPEDTETA